MHVTACLAGQDEVEVGEECRTLQALKGVVSRPLEAENHSKSDLSLTWLELAIDFEVSTGVRLTSHEGRLRRTMKEKATSMAHMAKSLREL